MSNIYVTEPPPSGRVVLETTRGEIEIELFAKECPRACKNFIALALEGYYDNLAWHRYLPDFIIQTGDPTGTGAGGESFYGEPFQDEIHSRLRFNRRGLLGMANGQERDTNESQFFLTLAPTPELQGKHTMFGRVVSNNTIYNLIALAESVGEVDENDQPKHPPKLKTVRVLENPFEGEIKLRITREERVAIRKNKREADKRNQEREKEAAQGQKKKNTALLSFGEAEEVDEGAALKGPKSSHDLLKNDKRLRPAAKSSEDSNGHHVKAAGVRLQTPPQLDGEVKAADGRGSDSGTRREASANRPPESSDRPSGSMQEMLKEHKQKKEETKSGKGRALLEQFRSAYKDKGDPSSKKRAAGRDEETARMLKTFQKRMRNGAADEAGAGPSTSRQERSASRSRAEDEIPADLREYGESDGEDDNDTNWRKHTFDFGGKSVLQDKHDDDEYITLDPRDSSANAARQLGFGSREDQGRAREERNRQEGRRGRDYVDERSHSSYRDRPREDRGQANGQRHDRRTDRPRQDHMTSRAVQRERSPPAPPRRDIERW